MKKIVIQVLLLPFPWPIRRMLLCTIFNFEISKTAHIGFSLILADKLKMKNNSRIGSLSFCKNIGLLSLDEYSSIGTLNYITGFPQNNDSFFSHRVGRKCELIVKKHSAITSRHFLDCTAGIYIGEFTTFAGLRSQILTHSIDLVENIQDCHSVNIGSFCFVGTNTVLLSGANLPDYCVLGAKSLLNKNFLAEYRLYGGVPAKEIAILEKDNMKYFHRLVGFVN